MHIFHHPKKTISTIYVGHFVWFYKNVSKTFQGFKTYLYLYCMYSTHTRECSLYEDTALLSNENVLNISHFFYWIKFVNYKLF